MSSKGSEILKCVGVKLSTEKQTYRYSNIVLTFKNDGESSELSLSKRDLNCLREIESESESVFTAYIAFNQGSETKSIVFQCNPHDYFTIEGFLHDEYDCSEVE